MNRTQKMAWFMLIVIVAALTLSVAAVGVLYLVLGFSIPRALGGLGFLGVAGLGGLVPLLFKKDKNKVQYDERDLLILNMASLAAYSIFWFLFVLAAMIPFFVLGPKGTISVKYLPAMVFGGMITVMLVQSIVTLEQYGWRNKGEKS